MYFLEILLGISIVAWLGAGALLVWNARGTRTLRPQTVLPPPERMPRVSIILAARNEEQALPAALDSLLGFDYPDYEVILVDDDSRDRTGEIARNYLDRAGATGKLRVIHNRDLPAGWRGKVHALSLAEQAATGEWILATDADVTAHPALLRLAVSLACESGAALVSLIPEFSFSSQSEKIVLPAFAFLLGLLYPARLVNSQKSRRAIAAGAFLLMRHEVLHSLGGYGALRETLIEDLRMAEMFKRNGFRVCLAMTRGLFRTTMYHDWREMFEGLSRSAFEGFGSSVLKTLGGIAVGIWLAVLPWAVSVGLAIRHFLDGSALAHDPAFLLAVAGTATCTLVYLPVVSFFNLSPLYALTLPLATLFYSAVAAASAGLSVSGPGLRWKGRVYQPPGPP